MSRLLKIGVFSLSLSALPLEAKTKQTPAVPKKPSTDDIIQNFSFVGDFELKEETRINSGHEIFWRYPYVIPKVTFDLDLEQDFNSEALKKEFPQTEGEGRAIEHLNSGRLLFLNQQVDEARKTWLGGRARYGKEYPYHRRNDYFIASSFLHLGIQKWRKNGYNYDESDLRQIFVNASTFLSWAFDRKKDLPDPLLDGLAPRAYYNLATIYYVYGRWAGVLGATNLGLDYLRKTGRSEYRREFRRMLAETYIKNQNYLEAIREYDVTLRQDEGVESSARIFARIGDIYFSLNNFELAEEVYDAANRIDSERNAITPSQYILRGESLFWIGKFDEARKQMQYALQTMSLPQVKQDVPLDMQALASLRIADSWLASKNMEKAKVAYFSHSQEFKGHITENYARIRLACLELPIYEGNNIRHARELLASLKDQADSLPSVAQEMAWTCETASYAQHERTAEMIERVRRFAELYPDSDLLRSLVDPVREVQSKSIDSFFANGDPHGAVQFFEKTRSFLYPQVSDELGRKLFEAYVDVHQSEKALPFLKAYEDGTLDASGLLRLAVALAEIGQSAEGKDREHWLKRNRNLVQRFFEKKLQFEQQPSVRLSFRRIMETEMGRIYRPWILGEALRWADADLSIGCDLVYPLMQTPAVGPDGHLPKEIAAKTQTFIETHLKNLLRFETNCAYSLMEFEISNPHASKAALVDVYLKRDYLPVDPQTAPLFWTLAEHVLKEGDHEGAERLWKFLVEKGNASMPEVRYAKARLDKRRTELEDLWQD